MNLAQIHQKINPAGSDKITSGRPASDLLLFHIEKRMALRNCGRIDPHEIGDYILSAGGYSGLARALEIGPEEVTREIGKAGLRGRGGAGYPTAQKWKNCREAEGDEKFLVCNAVDADPLARTARLILECDPHTVLEGMLIAAYACGASRCYLCVGSENSQAIELIHRALDQMLEYNLLGKNILDSGFNASISLKTLPSRLVAGEETALLRFLEGKQTMPFIRPPYPAIAGLNNHPTVVNNVETLADAAAILQKGAEWFRQTGTEKSKGSKVITVAGDVVRSYTLEVPFGATLRSVLDAGGAVSDITKIKAVQFGGTAGTFFTPGSLDLAIDFEALAESGAIMGSASLEVFSAEKCAVTIAAEKLAYLHEQSCGKCVFCREGTLQIASILDDLAKFQGQKQDLDLLADLGKLMRQGSICGLGKNASTPVLSTLNLFRSDYEAHLKGDKDHCGSQALST